MRAVLAVALAVLAAAGTAQGAVSVRVDRTEISTELGRKFDFSSTITNRGLAPATGLIAHLNVLSLRTGTYVDPEDWSSSRTRYLTPIPPGGTTTIRWRMEAVNDGRFGVYVAVLPASGAATPTTGPTVRVDVAERQTLDAGGILPLALGIPGTLGLLALGLRLRRRRAT